VWNGSGRFERGREQVQHTHERRKDINYARGGRSRVASTGKSKSAVSNVYRPHGFDRRTAKTKRKRSIRTTRRFGFSVLNSEIAKVTTDAHTQTDGTDLNKSTLRVHTYTYIYSAQTGPDKSARLLSPRTVSRVPAYYKHIQ